MRPEEDVPRNATTHGFGSLIALDAWLNWRLRVAADRALQDLRYRVQPTIGSSSCPTANRLSRACHSRPERRDFTRSAGNRRPRRPTRLCCCPRELRDHGHSFPHWLGERVPQSRSRLNTQPRSGWARGRSNDRFRRATDAARNQSDRTATGDVELRANVERPRVPKRGTCTRLACRGADAARHADSVRSRGG